MLFFKPKGQITSMYPWILPFVKLNPLSFWLFDILSYFWQSQHRFTAHTYNIIILILQAWARLGVAIEKIKLRRICEHKPNFDPILKLQFQLSTINYFRSYGHEKKGLVHQNSSVVGKLAMILPKRRIPLTCQKKG